MYYETTSYASQVPVCNCKDTNIFSFLPIYALLVKKSSTHIKLITKLLLNFFTPGFVLLHHRCLKVFHHYPFSSSTPQPVNSSTLQLFNPSTLQPFNSSTLNPSTLQPFNSSTLQPFNSSTLQRCLLSTGNPLSLVLILYVIMKFNE
jgi:hypothetical protein